MSDQRRLGPIAGILITCLAIAVLWHVVSRISYGASLADCRVRVVGHDGQPMAGIHMMGEWSLSIMPIEKFDFVRTDENGIADFGNLMSDLSRALVASPLIHVILPGYDSRIIPLQPEVEIQLPPLAELEVQLLEPDGRPLQRPPHEHSIGFINWTGTDHPDAGRRSRSFEFDEHGRARIGHAVVGSSIDLSVVSQPLWADRTIFVSAQPGETQVETFRVEQRD